MMLDNLEIAYRAKIAEKSEELKKALNIVEMISEISEVSKYDMLSKARNQRILIARQIAMYVIRTSTMLSFPEIGLIFNRDHSSVINSVKKVSEQLTHKRSIYRDLYMKLGGGISSKN